MLLLGVPTFPITLLGETTDPMLVDGAPTLPIAEPGGEFSGPAALPVAGTFAAGTVVGVLAVAAGLVAAGATAGTAALPGGTAVPALLPCVPVTPALLLGALALPALLPGAPVPMLFAGATVVAAAGGAAVLPDGISPVLPIAAGAPAVAGVPGTAFVVVPVPPPVVAPAELLTRGVGVAPVVPVC
jgi:hypothetical protein